MVSNLGKEKTKDTIKLDVLGKGWNDFFKYDWSLEMVVSGEEDWRTLLQKIVF